MSGELKLLSFPDGVETASATDITPVATPTTAGLVTSFTPVVQSSMFSVAGNYTVLDGDGYLEIYMDASGGTSTLTLPNPANNVGRIITLRKSDTSTNVVRMNPGANTINGVTDDIGLEGKYNCVTVISNGTEWFLKGPCWLFGSKLLDGDYTSGTLFYQRVGEMVTVSFGTSATHASLSIASTSSGFLPIEYRTSTTREAMVSVEATRVVILQILTDGSVKTHYRDWTGQFTNDVDTHRAPSMTYYAPQ